MMRFGGVHEIFHVVRQVPGQVIVFSDYTIFA
jgi:hypothetical protein